MATQIESFSTSYSKIALCVLADYAQNAEQWAELRSEIKSVVTIDNHQFVTYDDAVDLLARLIAPLDNFPVYARLDGDDQVALVFKGYYDALLLSFHLHYRTNEFRVVDLEGYNFVVAENGRKFKDVSIITVQVLNAD